MIHSLSTADGYWFCHQHNLSGAAQQISVIAFWTTEVVGVVKKHGNNCWKKKSPNEIPS